MYLWKRKRADAATKVLRVNAKTLATGKHQGSAKAKPGNDEPFHNAITQTPFPNQTMADSVSVNNDNGKALQLAKELRSAILWVEESEQQVPLEPVDLEKSLRAIKTEWHPNTQQDAFEAWQTFTEAFHTSTNKAKGDVATFQYPVEDGVLTSSDKNWQAILKHQSDSCGDRLFLAQYVIQRTCTSCQSPTELTFCTFTNIQVPKPMDVRSSAKRDGTAIPFEKLLAAKYRETLVDKNCDICDDRVNFSTSYLLTRLPEYLVFTLVRFEYGPIKNRINDPVEFAVDGLDMYEHVHPEMRATNTRYDCRAVVHHRGGTMRAGHFVVYIQEELADGLGRQGFSTMTMLYQWRARTRLW